MKATTLFGYSRVFTKFTTCTLLFATLVFNGSGALAAQAGTVDEYGEVKGKNGTATATFTVNPASYATVIAVARVSGGKLVGGGNIPRAGVGVDIYVDDEICTSDRDMRRGITAEVFDGSFGSSATCMTVLGPGQHVVLAEKVSVNVEGAKMVLKYTILGGEPVKTNLSSQ